jgi:hypothetical protein
MEKLLGVAVTPVGRLVSVQETVPEKLFTPSMLTVTVPPPEVLALIVPDERFTR